MAMREDCQYTSLCPEAGRTPFVKDADGGFQSMIQSEAPVFESILLGLAPQQIALVKAIAKEPSPSILSANYMNKHKLKSVGGVQAALKKLMQQDLVEKRDNKIWTVVDPVFGKWLNGYSIF
jgi:hypothetical protein